MKIFKPMHFLDIWKAIWYYVYSLEAENRISIWPLYEPLPLILIRNVPLKHPLKTLMFLNYNQIHRPFLVDIQIYLYLLINKNINCIDVIVK